MRWLLSFFSLKSIIADSLEAWGGLSDGWTGCHDATSVTSVQVTNCPREYDIRLQSRKLPMRRGLEDAWCAGYVSIWFARLVAVWIIHSLLSLVVYAMQLRSGSFIRTAHYERSCHEDIDVRSVCEVMRNCQQLRKHCI